ncbi:sensor histidine kinase [Actinoplanes solisilvae]|uniref:sensor histidine kinase n=1 Tax=Actinoplanes solisilvae TaxID=2486853 RepID=UPI000FDA610A|nr:histidine kinase [Actinoplanes solisilvae]
MGWAARLFDKRDTWVRLLLLDASGLTYLIFAAREDRAVSTMQWVLALVGFVTVVVLSQRPVVNLLTQTGLLVVALVVVDDPLINVVGSSWVLGELVVRAARPWVYLAGAALLTAVHLSFTLDVLDLILPIGLPLLIGLVLRTSRELAEQAEQRAASERRAVRADERAAIARELHDVVAHHVASMVLRVGVARHVLPDPDPRVGDVLDDVHRTGTAALADLRRLVAVLRDEGATPTAAALTAIDPGSLPAALGVAVDTARGTGLTVEADIDDAVGTIDSVRGMAVLRLTQEALTNVAKHAGPTARARLRVAVEEDTVIWEVTDDGGAAPVPATPGGGHGLTGMRERVEVLGGELTAGRDGPGWRVSTVLPTGVAP